MNRRVLLIAILLVSCFEPALKPAALQVQSEPLVRIGLDQNASAVNIRSADPFTILRQRTRTARFSSVLAVNPAQANNALRKQDLQYRMIIEIDEGRVLAPPLNTTIRIEPAANARLQVGDRSYRGAIEVLGNSRNSLTVVNELPLEQYLLGVVPNELSPTTFGQLEALKAQAVAARTYIIRNLGQYKRQGFDICASDACQVYFGAGTEHPLATQAVEETRGIVATYAGRPINALYSSTCGGRTESAENIFDEKAPYLVSVMCEYKHPEPKPFSSTQSIGSYEDAVLKVAGVSNFTELRRFLGIPGQGEPVGDSAEELAAFVRQNFYPTVKPAVSDLEFLREQGILPGTRTEVLFRLIEKKGAFEWQQGVLTAWDGETMGFIVGGQPRSYRLSPDAPIFQRIGDDRIPMQTGAWIGGELFDFRVVDDVIQMAVYRRNFVNPSADRYSRLAMWQAHKTKQEIDAAFAPLNIGSVQGLRVLQRGESERPISTEVTGSRGRQVVRALRLRSLLGLRDSLFYFDEERNARGELIGITFFGSGWGHGVGMCQVGAYGMALDGATYDEILKKYYTGIDLQKSY